MKTKKITGVLLENRKLGDGSADDPEVLYWAMSVRLIRKIAPEVRVLLPQANRILDEAPEPLYRLAEQTRRISCNTLEEFQAILRVWAVALAVYRKANIRQPSYPEKQGVIVILIEGRAITPDWELLLSN